MFTVLVTAHLLYAFAARQPSRGILSNRWLLLAVAGGVALQFLVVVWPAAHDLFGTTRLSHREWTVVEAWECDIRQQTPMVAERVASELQRHRRVHATSLTGTTERL